MTHIVSEQVARTPAQTGTAAKPFLPTTRRGWLIVASVVAVILLASLGWLTNGRAGLVGVVGNSMMSVMPQGSSVITLPLPPREGDYVVALASAPDDRSGSLPGDCSRSLVVKKYHAGQLVSTDDANMYSMYEYRGRVVACVPTQKILFWRDKGAQRPAPGAVSYHTVSEVSAIRTEADIKEKAFDAILRGLNGYKSEEIVLGRANPMVVAVVVDKMTVDTGMWVVKFNPALHLVSENSVGLRVYRSEKPVTLDSKIQGSPPQHDLKVKAVLP
ncbi:MAG: hypothetical protein BWY43_00655 [candidate division WS2 bacterium ADurb.Bin280]|uniref:Uncharacterized protein n=1 Tax=candidate division WS2 bacterium ADurb.Bin280 TaxID=1852829 RepID=A0A1V5SDI5_9BACT|nr:MAG: hypothetical protein BWY43_00655 [candidate division WS2 bacterium ADurb.Bin280]